MPSTFTADQAADRKHDLGKTIDFPPGGADAHTVAMLARAKSTSIEDAADLIEAFAKVEASRAVTGALEATQIRIAELETELSFAEEYRR